MSQEQFELICKIIQNGAPALANELINALNALVQEYLQLSKAQNNNVEDSSQSKEPTT